MAWAPVPTNSAALFSSRDRALIARTYEELARALTQKPAETLFVGDEPNADVAGSRAVGMQTVWVDRGGNAWPAALPAVDALVANLDALVTRLTF